MSRGGGGGPSTTSYRKCSEKHKILNIHTTLDKHDIILFGDENSAIDNETCEESENKPTNVKILNNF